MLVSAVQQSESTLCTHIPAFFIENLNIDDSPSESSDTFIDVTVEQDE